MIASRAESLNTKSEILFCGGYSTTNIQRRIAQHKQFHTHTTSRMGSFAVVFAQEFSDLVTARAIERRLKNLKRKNYIQKVIDDGFIKLEPII